MTSQDAGPAPVPRSRRRAALMAAALVAVASVGTTATVHARSAWSPSAAAASRPATATPGPTPMASVSGLGAAGTVRWQDPLVVTATDAVLTAVTGTDPDGGAVTGTVGADGRWTYAGALFPSSTYQLVAQVRNAGGTSRDLPLTVGTTAPDKTLGVTLIPGDGASVGVGQALSVRLATPVKDAASRAAVEKHLTVTTVPAVAGAWRWMSSTELRYRGAGFWATGTTITMTAALAHVQAAPGVWGAGSHTSRVTVGDARTSVVDTTAHTMTVSTNGQVIRTMRASMGKPEFATRNGTFVVLEKFADLVMDSATVDLPPGTPAYKTAVKDAVRITNSGTFTHGAPWSVPSQGVANVSHGCINLSPTDAHWYFLQATRGDVVRVVNSTSGPALSDAGSQDWNMSFAQWRSGSALA